MLSRFNSAATDADNAEHDIVLRKLAEGKRPTRLDAIHDQFVKVGRQRLFGKEPDRRLDIWEPQPTAAEKFASDLSDTMGTPEGLAMIKASAQIGADLGNKIFSENPAAALELAKVAEPINPSAPGSLFSFIKQASQIKEAAPAASFWEGLAKNVNLTHVGVGAGVGAAGGFLATPDPDDTLRNTLMGAALGAGSGHVYSQPGTQKIITDIFKSTGKGKGKRKGRPAATPAAPAVPATPAAPISPDISKVKAEQEAQRAARRAIMREKPTPVGTPKPGALPVPPDADFSPARATGLGAAEIAQSHVGKSGPAASGDVIPVSLVSKEPLVSRLKAPPVGARVPEGMRQAVTEAQSLQGMTPSEQFEKVIAPAAPAAGETYVTPKQKRMMKKKNALSAGLFEKLAAIMKESKRGGPISIALGAAIPAAMQLHAGATDLGDVLAPALGGGLAAAESGAPGVFSGVSSNLLLRRMKDDPESLLSAGLKRLPPDMATAAYRTGQIGIPPLASGAADRFFGA